MQSKFLQNSSGLLKWYIVAHSLTNSNLSFSNILPEHINFNLFWIFNIHYWWVVHLLYKSNHSIGILGVEANGRSFLILFIISSSKLILSNSCFALILLNYWFWLTNRQYHSFFWESLSYISMKWKIKCFFTKLLCAYKTFVSTSNGTKILARGDCSLKIGRL